MAFTEDFSPFFADFGATATPATGAAVTVIFDKATIATLGGDITSDNPVALAVTADVAAWTSNVTTVTIASASYTLRDKRPDGTGMSLLELEDA
jgi:hypothetical protein